MFPSFQCHCQFFVFVHFWYLTIFQIFNPCILNVLAHLDSSLCTPYSVSSHAVISSANAITFSSSAIAVYFYEISSNIMLKRKGDKHFIVSFLYHNYTFWYNFALFIFILSTIPSSSTHLYILSLHLVKNFLYVNKCHNSLYHTPIFYLR